MNSETYVWPAVLLVMNNRQSIGTKFRYIAHGQQTSTRGNNLERGSIKIQHRILTDNYSDTCMCLCKSLVTQ